MQQKIKEIVEAAGMCWHYVMLDKLRDVQYCHKCNIESHTGISNPSPTDLNALMEIAEKLGYGVQLNKGIVAVCSAKIWTDRDGVISNEVADTLAEALLLAIHQAVNGGK